jgi:CheY-like chemotaxis protein
MKLLFWRKKSIEGLKIAMTRDEILRRSRILIVDDESPDLIDDLKKAHFSVDYVKDITNENLELIDRPLYDLMILDYGNVGREFGSDQGLSLLKHAKRVNPSLVVLAYTSKSLPSSQADFYRMSDGILSKDAGIGESMEKIEEALKKAFNVKNLWLGFLHAAGVAPGSETDLMWQTLFVEGVSNQNKMKEFRMKAMGFFSGDNSKQIGIAILEKLVEISLKALIG